MLSCLKLFKLAVKMQFHFECCLTIVNVFVATTLEHCTVEFKQVRQTTVI